MSSESVIPFTSCTISKITTTKQLLIPNSNPEEQILAFDPGHVTFVFDPSPTVMIGACLVLGCVISSFAYRRQEDDRFQAPIFVLAITAATISGLALDVNANVIMLVLIPWALCTAMILSTVIHWFLRRCSIRRYERVYCCELGEKRECDNDEKSSLR